MSDTDKHPKKIPDGVARLRRRAEEAASQKLDVSIENIEAHSPETASQILHELQVHQIELEMQNEELRFTQAKLDAARERYFDLYDLAPVGYCTISEPGIIQEANLTAATLLGVARGSLVNQPIHKFIIKEDQDIFYLHRKKLFETGEPLAFEIRLVKKDKTSFWTRLEAALAHDADGVSLFRVVLIDISERKRAEDEVRRLAERISQIQKLEALGVLVAGVAHNMNNVLAAIMAAASVRELNVSEPADLETYRIIGAACRRGREVIKSLRQFARPAPKNQAPIELHELIDEVFVLLKNTTMNRIEIIKVFSPGDIWIMGDSGSLNHALLNLCLNALDAMPEGGTLTLRTAIPDEDWVTVYVVDDGCGMSPETLAHVMEPFFTTKPVGKGTGLGLSMTYGVIKAHGGTLEISSQPDRGTAVKIRLPRIAAPVRAAAVGTPPCAPLGRLTVLLVDDDPDVRKLAAKMLEAAGLAVTSVCGGKEALESLLEGPVPDLIILDQNMPVMNGTKTMEQILVRHPDVRILISSGQPDIEDWVCFKRPNVAVISKPFDIGELKAKLALIACP